MNLSEDIILPGEQKELPPFVWYPRLFSAPEIGELIRLGESNQLQMGRIGNGIENENVEDLGYRCVFTSPIYRAEAPWAFERLRDRVRWSNDEYFHFDLHGLHEQLVFLKYVWDEANPGKYNWHQDTGGGMSSLRKLSTVTQLSPASNYGSCELKLFTNGEMVIPHKDPGDTIIFPSYTPHCVTPIDFGVRYALVSWVTGKPFR